MRSAWNETTLDHRTPNHWRTSRPCSRHVSGRLSDREFLQAPQRGAPRARHATWARVSQASLIRLPSLAEEEDTALELRSPDPMANPYLSFAVALASALDGIRQSEEPPDALDESFVSYDDEELQRLGIPRLPGTLGEAISAFTEDSTIQSTLGDYVVDQLLTVKQAEWEDYRRHVSPWELARYGDA